MDEILGKKIADLPEKADPVDTDVYVFGDVGSNVLKKTKWRKMLDAIAAKLTANNLTTNVAGFFLDARQGKALKDEVDELNTKIKFVTYQLTGTENASANTWNYIPDAGYRAPQGYRIASVCGASVGWPYASVNPLVMSSGAIFVWYFKANSQGNDLSKINLYITLEKM